MNDNAPLTSSQRASKLCDASNREHFGIRSDQVVFHYTWFKALRNNDVKPANHVVYKLLHRALHLQTALIKVLTHLHTPFSRDTRPLWETNLNGITAQWGDEQVSMCGRGSKTFVKDCLKVPPLKGSNKHSANEQHPPNAAPLLHRAGTVFAASFYAKPNLNRPQRT